MFAQDPFDTHCLRFSKYMFNYRIRFDGVLVPSGKKLNCI